MSHLISCFKRSTDISAHKIARKVISMSGREECNMLTDVISSRSGLMLSSSFNFKKKQINQTTLKN